MSENKTPLISVGIPTYNRPDGLRRTLGEISKQTYQNLEIIVSDNASPTNEVENVVREFMLSDNRIRYFRQELNIGIQTNFQFVLEKSSGEYFIWCADDDWHKPEYIAALLEARHADESSVIAFCNFDIRDENGKRLSDHPDSSAALRLMAGENSLIRRLRFFILPEGRAIPHAIYGLLPMSILRNFSWQMFIRRYGEYGADTLFVFWLLGQGRLTLSECKLFGCTVNNQKHYIPAQKSSLVKRFRSVRERINYLLSFIRIAKGWTRLALLCVFPLKLAETFYSMTVREPLRSVIRAHKAR
ncbi:MAG: glycosyltransferase family 2 protein [Gallionella sp.]|nr:glycosyltransferase family 2 protein [Gallionella sp.]